MCVQVQEKIPQRSIQCVFVCAREDPIKWHPMFVQVQEKILKCSLKCVRARKCKRRSCIVASSAWVCACKCKRRSYNVASIVCFCARQEKILYCSIQRARTSAREDHIA